MLALPRGAPLLLAFFVSPAGARVIAPNSIQALFGGGFVVSAGAAARALSPAGARAFQHRLADPRGHGRGAPGATRRALRDGRGATGAARRANRPNKTYLILKEIHKPNSYESLGPCNLLPQKVQKALESAKIVRGLAAGAQVAMLPPLARGN
jgi:hypothetical protein